jgi:UDP-N-acetylmuramoyl-L-alanyl-D-glutamate--2,6-diaminopimelate ligase
LFVDAQPHVSIVNVDDQYGARLAEELPAAVTFAIDREADFRAVNLKSGLAGSEFTLRDQNTEVGVRLPLIGRFNVYNALGALAGAHAVGVSVETGIQALQHAGQVPGRFQIVPGDQGFAVIVDYAHTPDSLENVLTAARSLTQQRLHVVFGCGGDRDRGKRPLMGAIAARLADRVIVTSDNPRSEDPEAIIREILAGLNGGSGLDTAIEHEVDRRAAIEEAISSAQSGDVVVIAGKGHEQGQEFAGGRKIPFDDVTVAREILGTSR